MASDAYMGGVFWRFKERVVWLQLNAGMKRALEAFQEAILMVDASAQGGWTVLHVNSSFLQQTGAHLDLPYFHLTSNLCRAVTVDSPISICKARDQYCSV